MSALTTLAPAERARLEAAYEDETGRILRARVGLAVALYMAVLAAWWLAELTYHPERLPLTALYLWDVLSGAGVAAAARRPRFQRWTRDLVVGFTALLACRMALYGALVGAPAERQAMVLATLLSGIAVMMPLGWRAQLAIAVSAISALGLAGPRLVGGDALAFSLCAAAGVAATSVAGAYFLDRYRHEAFVRTALEEDEAIVAAALLGVGETLSAHLDDPDLHARVAGLAAEAMGASWCLAWFLDEQRRSFRLGGGVGLGAERYRQLAALDFPAGDVPLLAVLQPGRLLEIPDLTRQAVVPPEILRGATTRALVYTPICRREQTVAILALGWVEERGPFTPRERRLALGIAHASAIALQNAKLIADLQAASRLKSDFVSSMSHELRTPLNVLTGYGDLLVEGAFGALTPEQRDTLHRMRRSTSELLELVNATLDVSRLEAGRDAAMVGPFALEPLFAEIDLEVQPLVAPGVALGWTDRTGVGSVESDRAKVKRILKNLVSNAIKFTSAGTVAVEAAWADGWLTLTVRDSGIGMDPAALPHIFDMFRQLDPSTTRRFGGVGLGLHIVKRLVDLLGGTVHVESAPGAGSTFTVRLPAPAEGAQRAGEARRQSGGAGRPRST